MRSISRQICLCRREPVLPCFLNITMGCAMFMCPHAIAIVRAACALIAASCLGLTAGVAGAAPVPSASTAATPVADSAGTRAESSPLLAVAPADAFQCAHTLQNGVVSTRALINYAYADPNARTRASAPLASGQGGMRGLSLTGQRIAQESVCRMWHGPLRALEVSALLRSIAAEHPERQGVIVLGIVAQD